MEIPYIPKTGYQKSEETKKIDIPQRLKVSNYAKDSQAADSIDLSAKAKLMQSLRAAYDKLPDNDRRAKEVENKIIMETYKLSSEEIVTHILKGTLFEV